MKSLLIKTMLIALLFPFCVVGMLVEGQDSGTSYTVTSDQAVNARSCPRLNCNVVTTFAPGTSVTVLDTVNGDEIFGSSQWHHALHNGNDVYIHSVLLTSASAEQQTVVSETLPTENWAEYTAAGVRILAPQSWVDFSDDAETLVQFGIRLVPDAPLLSDTDIEAMSTALNNTIVVIDPQSGNFLMVLVQYTGLDTPLRMVQAFYPRSPGETILTNEIVEIPAGQAMYVHSLYEAQTALVPSYEQHAYVLVAERTNFMVMIGGTAVDDGLQAIARTIADSFEIMSAADGRSYAVEDAGTAHPGENAAVLTAGKFHVWTYSGTAGETITVTAIADDTSQGLDTILVVRDANGTVLAENDDSGWFGTNTNAQIREMTLPETGDYVIEVLAYGGSNGGAYTLVIERQ